MKDFLNRYLGSQWSVQSLKGDSGERQYSRVHVPPNKSFILVSYPRELKNKLNVFISIQKILREKNVLVPKIFFATQEFLLIEDLGDLSLETFHSKHHHLSYYKIAIDQMIRLQETLKDFTFEKNFTSNQSLHEMITTYQQFHLSFKESEKVKLFEEFQDISQKLSSQSLVPSHRDFHSRNLHIHKDQVYMIDFQDAGLYPTYYDLVSLIEDVYVSLSENERNTLMEYYSEKVNHSIHSVDWHITVCQRLFKAVGSFMSFYNLRSQKTHLKYISPALERVQSSLVQLDSYPYLLQYTQTVLNQL